MPGCVHICPNKAACWSPATPVIGTPPRARLVETRAYFALQRELAEEYANCYGDGIIELRIAGADYERFFKAFEQPYQEGKSAQVAIPNSMLVGLVTCVWWTLMRHPPYGLDAVFPGVAVSIAAFVGVSFFGHAGSG